MAFLRGTVETVEPPNEHGWSKIMVRAEGHDRPVRLDTNRDEHMREAVDLRNERVYVAVEYDEKSKYDQRTGRSYLNRYWIRAARVGAPEQQGGWAGPNGQAVNVTPSQSGSNVTAFDKPASDEYQRRTHPRDAWRICLSVGTERALQTLPYLPVEQRTPAIQREIALFWARFIFYTEQEQDDRSIPGPVGSNDDPATRPSDTPWPTDDDIPF